MTFSPITEMMIQKFKGFIPLFIGIALMAFIANKSYDVFGFKGLAIYALIVIFAQLHQINSTLREVKH